MYKVFICEISDDEGQRTQRYAVSAGNEEEARKAMVRFLGTEFRIRVIREATLEEAHHYGEIPAGTITLLQ